jgi:hypothetical protein
LWRGVDLRSSRKTNPQVSLSRSHESHWSHPLAALAAYPLEDKYDYE